MSTPQFYSVWQFDGTREDFVCVGIGQHADGDVAATVNFQGPNGERRAQISHATMEELVEHLLKSRLGVLADSLLRLELRSGKHPGLPSSCERGQFIGYARNGEVYVLSWKQEHKAWAGVGFAGPLAEPHVVLAKDDMANFFTAHVKIANP